MRADWKQLMSKNNFICFGRLYHSKPLFPNIFSMRKLVTLVKLEIRNKDIFNIFEFLSVYFLFYARLNKLSKIVFLRLMYHLFHVLLDKDVGSTLLVIYRHYWRDSRFLRIYHHDVRVCRFVWKREKMPSVRIFQRATLQGVRTDLFHSRTNYFNYRCCFEMAAETKTPEIRSTGVKHRRNQLYRWN
jgi:hypothetical protein